MLSYIIVGSGWRAEFYGRIARTYPDLFRAVFLCRSEEKAQLMKARTGVDAVMTEHEELALCPDFIVAAVDRNHLVDVTEYWTRKGFPVVVETPVGDTGDRSVRRSVSGDRMPECGRKRFHPEALPRPGGHIARVRRTIELFEGRRIIQSTERDPLTGLYNREFFFGYAEQYDQHHRDTPMDAIVLDINRFGIINERYGRACADEVLRRMGVYSNVDKSLDLEHRFDRAKMASDSVHNSFTRNIAVYDDTLHKAELYSEQLSRISPEPLMKSSSGYSSSRNSTSPVTSHTWPARRVWCAGSTRSWA